MSPSSNVPKPRGRPITRRPDDVNIIVWGLHPTQKAYARKVGQGNVSKGLRYLLDFMMESYPDYQPEEFTNGNSKD